MCVCVCVCVSFFVLFVCSFALGLFHIKTLIFLKWCVNIGWGKSLLLIRENQKLRVFDVFLNNIQRLSYIVFWTRIRNSLEKCKIELKLMYFFG